MWVSPIFTLRCPCTLTSVSSVTSKFRTDARKPIGLTCMEFRISRSAREQCKTVVKSIHMSGNHGDMMALVFHWWSKIFWRVMRFQCLQTLFSFGYRSAAFFTRVLLVQMSSFFLMTQQSLKIWFIQHGSCKTRERKIILIKPINS